MLTLFNSKQIQDFVFSRRDHGLLWSLPISRFPIDLYLLDAFYVTCPSGLLLLLVTNMTTRILCHYDFVSARLSKPTI